MNKGTKVSSIAYISGVGPNRAAALTSELGIREIADFFSLVPIRYVDKTKFYKISELYENGSDVQIIGVLSNIRKTKQKRGFVIKANLTDATGSIELIWFKGGDWLMNSLKLNVPYVIFGKLNVFKGNFSIAHPEMELLSLAEKRRQQGIKPIYPSTEKLVAKGVSNKVLTGIIETVFKTYFHQIQESLAETIVLENDFISKKEALLNLHFPKSQEMLAAAKRRLKFEELFFLQLQMVKRKDFTNKKIVGYPFANVGNYFLSFYNHQLAFELTNAQKRVLKEIRKDLGSGIHMNRLLQGDVGSGKTIVATLSMLMAVDNGFQASIIAPTEILAQQHFKSICEPLEAIGVTVALLTGSTTAKKRKTIHQDLFSGELKVLVGTHAILEDKVVFQNLGIAIVDEQHRFGVEQRSKMWLKNKKPPHILVMTATPIPRTLAMSVYGDLDVSVIDELPPGRKEVKTVHRYDKNRLRVFHFLKEEIKMGRQVYIVYPLIEESASMDYKDLMDGYESIAREFPLPDYKISIVHGKMPAKDKEYEMRRFIKGETQIMVATTVIEVGVNVPNASVMVIESSERFGLSQLHQLRGRVGRGAEQSYCILMSSYKLSADGKKRLQTMVDTSDGFEIAEVDLKLRGPGNLLGKQQSGVLNLKVANIVKDGELLALARRIAIKIIQDDPGLLLPKHKSMAQILSTSLEKSTLWSNIS